MGEVQALLAAAWTRADLLSVLGLFVSIIGFSVAALQLARTARAAEATTQAVQGANRSHMLLLLPQFRLSEIELDHALQEGGRPQATRVLMSCAYLANEVAGLLTANPAAFGDDATPLATELRRVGTLASHAKHAIYARPQKQLVTLTAEFREALAAAVQRLAQLQMAIQTPGPG